MSQKPPIVFTCPFCGCTENRVIDARGSWAEDEARRRRRCTSCLKVFRTREQLERSENDHPPY